MKLSLNQAAKEANKAKSTLLLSIKNGDLSAPKSKSGRYEIDPAELFRVFPKTTENHLTEPKPTPSENHTKTSVLEKEVEMLREMLRKSEEREGKWQRQAESITALIEDKRKKVGWLDKFLGRG